MGLEIDFLAYEESSEFHKIMSDTNTGMNTMDLKRIDVNVI